MIFCDSTELSNFVLRLRRLLTYAVRRRCVYVLPFVARIRRAVARIAVSAIRAFGFGACALWATYAAAGALLAGWANTRAIFDRSHEDEGNGWNHSTV